MSDEKKKFQTLDELFAHLRSLEVAPEPPLPPLAENEYLHFEYVQWNPIEEGGHYSNMVDVAHSRDEALSKLRELIGSDYVYAIHVRRYPQKEDGVHAYDEVQPFKVAQSKAYMAELRAEQLDRALEAERRSKQGLEDGYEMIVRGLEDTEKALTRVVEKLMDAMRRTHTQLKRDNQGCSYSEPMDLMNLLFGVGITPDEQWEREMLRDAREAVRKERKHREAVDLAQRTGVWPLAPLVGASARRRCACGMTWHMDEVPSWHNGLECQPYPGCAEEECGHPEERHVEMLPEEGGHTFCTECGGQGYQHDFKAPK